MQCVGDEKTGHWLQSFAKTSRLFPKMQSARDIGGAIGAVAVGLRALNGEPRIELFDPRFTRQIWADREALVLRALDIRYKIPVSVLTGRGPVIWVQNQCGSILLIEYGFATLSLSLADSK